MLSGITVAAKSLKPSILILAAEPLGALMIRSHIQNYTKIRVPIITWIYKQCSATTFLAGFLRPQLFLSALFLLFSLANY